MPDIIPSFTSGYTLESVRTWLKERPWIKLNVVEVKEGSSLYDASYPHNKVIDQSIAYGVKTENVKELTIWVIKHSIDCSLEEYRSYDDCSEEFVVPDFVGMTLQEVRKWEDNHTNISVRIVTETHLEDTLNSNKIFKQSVEPYTLLSTITNITVYYNKVPLDIYVDTTQLFNVNGKGNIEYWIINQGFESYTTEEVYDDNIPAGELISISINGNAYTSSSASFYAKSDATLKLKISKGQEPTVTIPDFTNTNISEYINFINQYGLASNAVSTSTDDSSLDGVIRWQSIIAGSVVKESQLSSLTVEYYSYTANSGE